MDPTCAVAFFEDIPLPHPCMYRQGTRNPEALRSPPVSKHHSPTLKPDLPCDTEVADSTGKAGVLYKVHFEAEG